MKTARMWAAAIACTIGPVAGAVLVSGTPAVAQDRGSARQQAYRINPGDDIEVYVWGEERLTREIRVLPDGTFSFPLVGRIDAAGKLPSEIEAAITKGLSGQFRDQVPQVTVSVKVPAGYQFSVMGKVKAPSSFTPGKYVNALEAVGLAGGPTEFADLSNVLILRKQGSELVPIRVRLNDVMKGNPSQRDLSGLPQLQTGDTVIVP